MNNFIHFFHKYVLIFSIWFISFFFIISLSIKDLFFKAKFININRLIYLVNKKDSFIIDSRSRKNFLSGHIPNSLNIPFKKINDFDIKKLFYLKNKKIIFIFDSHIYLNHYIKIFINVGFKKLYILKNGLDKWNAKNLPLISKNNL
ncbi:rhodanese-like domain-containing protein [Buchnera aphidicola (Periphyllus koelreuteriae)]|uniref:rhodanese-like domain-containing protein n=1 Tax=Buchnera aphidicola TaxID=9 RepID=UPI0031B7F3E0